MTTEIALKIINDSKMHDFLINNSYWYKELNRSPDNFKEFMEAFKADKRNKRISKVNSTVDTLDTVNLILKTLK
jgi:predicted ribonuclease toxin of YeeF-YezG toxin-antitoxin module